MFEKGQTKNSSNLDNFISSNTVVWKTQTLHTVGFKITATPHVGNLSMSYKACHPKVHCFTSQNESESSVISQWVNWLISIFLVLKKAKLVFSWLQEHTHLLSSKMHYLNHSRRLCAGNHQMVVICITHTTSLRPTLHTTSTTFHVLQGLNGTSIIKSLFPAHSDPAVFLSFYTFQPLLRVNRVDFFLQKQIHSHVILKETPTNYIS